MTRIIERVEAHYESREVPFGKTYEWHLGSVILECDCGERLTLTSATTITRCGCGADHGAVVRDIQKREVRLRRRSPTPGTMTLENGQSNIYGTRPPILKARPGVTTILRGILSSGL